MNDQMLTESVTADPEGLSRMRLITVVILVTVATIIMLAASPVRADDDDDSRGITGTVMSVRETSLSVAIKSGLKTVFVDSDTEIKRGRNEISISGIKPGDRISARIEIISEGQLLATSLKVRGKSTDIQVEHLTGVVIEQEDRRFRLATRDGRSVEIELDDDDEPPAVADVVTTVVENDRATGKIRTRQLERVEKIVQRLEDSLSREIDEAKAGVLRKIIDESARQHLNTLNETLDQVEVEAKEKIEAALAKFRSDYTAVAERVGNTPPVESYEGVIAEISSSLLRISSASGEGSRSFEINEATGIVINGVPNASTVDLVLGQSVVVNFVAETDDGDSVPVALVIEALPPALPPVVAEAIDDLSDDVVEGDITVVEDPGTGGSSVVIIEEDGTGDTVGVEVTPDTAITIDGEPGTVDQLQPEQQVEVTTEEDGVTAESLIVTSQEPSPAEESFSGVVSGNDPDRLVIVVTPASGEAMRLTVRATAVITLDGATATLGDIQVHDLVLATSRYLPEPGEVTRLAIARPAPASQPGEGTDQQPGGSEPAPPAGSGGETSQPPSPQPFSIRGFLKSFDGDSIVFDGMTLPKSSGFELPEGATAGTELDLVFTIAEDGAVVLTGIQMP